MPATHPSSRHDRSDPLPSLESRVATYAVSQFHGSAPVLVTVLASSCAVARNGNTPRTTTIVSQTTSGLWRTHLCAVLTPITLTLCQVVSFDKAGVDSRADRRMGQTRRHGFRCPEDDSCAHVHQAS